MNNNEIKKTKVIKLTKAQQEEIIEKMKDEAANGAKRREAMKKNVLWICAGKTEADEDEIEEEEAPITIEVSNGGSSVDREQEKKDNERKEALSTPEAWKNKMRYQHSYTCLICEVGHHHTAEVSCDGYFRIMRMKCNQCQYVNGSDYEELTATEKLEWSQIQKRQYK